jgi:alpha-mannosidase
MSDKVDYLDGDCEIAVVEAHPLRCAVKVERAIGAESRLWQTYRLDAASGRLEVFTEVEWHETQRLLRALFPCGVRARNAWFGTQYGAIERPIHRNTSWEEARFEVPGHAWMDVAEPRFRCRNSRRWPLRPQRARECAWRNARFSLLKSPLFPDPNCDRGAHAFTYALMPHAGDWRAAGVDRAADCLREPLRAVALEAGKRAHCAVHGRRSTCFRRSRCALKSARGSQRKMVAVAFCGWSKRVARGATSRSSGTSTRSA